MLHHRLILAAALVPAAVATAAAPAPPAPIASEHRLTEAEVAQVLEQAAHKREATEQAPRDQRKIHGEVGLSVGTGGYRSIYGTAVVPILNDGLAILSIDSTDFEARDRWDGRVRR